jgi:ornithine cyclodeaminase
MHKIFQLDDEYMYGNTIFSELILEVKRGFAAQSIMFSMCNHHDFPSPEVGIDSTIRLIMPAWNQSKEAAVKTVTVSPEN